MGANAKSSESDQDIVGINVTPLVDVTLVLLIVFLVVTKTVVSRSIPVDVPRRAETTMVQTVLAVRVDATGAIALDGKPLTDREALVRAASDARTRDKDVRAVIRAPSDASHGAVVNAIDALRSAGVTKIAFATEKKNE